MDIKGVVKPEDFGGGPTKKDNWQAINKCLGAGNIIRFGSGVYEYSQPIKYKGEGIVFEGNGKHTTQLLVSDPKANGFEVESTTAWDNIAFRNMSIVTNNISEGNNISAIKYTSSAPGGTGPIFEDLDLRGAGTWDGANRFWNTGLDLNNVWYGFINRVFTTGNWNNFNKAANAIVIRGDGAVLNIRDSVLIFCGCGIRVDKGTMEGIVIDGTNIVGGNYGIWHETAGQEPALTVQNTHVNVYLGGIISKMAAWTLIDNCSIIVNRDMGHAVGIELGWYAKQGGVRGSVIGAFGTKNTFTGIKVDASYNSIMGNHIASFNKIGSTGILLSNLSSYCTVIGNTTSAAPVVNKGSGNQVGFNAGT